MALLTITIITSLWFVNMYLQNKVNVISWICSFHILHVQLKDASQTSARGVCLNPSKAWQGTSKYIIIIHTLTSDLLAASLHLPLVNSWLCQLRYQAKDDWDLWPLWCIHHFIQSPTLPLTELGPTNSALFQQYK